MKKFLNKAPQIALKTITREKLSQGQKEAMHGIRAVINGEPTPEQKREFDAEKQRAADAEMQLQQQRSAADTAAEEALVQQQRAAEAEKQTQLLRQQLEKAKAEKAAMDANKALEENIKLQAELDLFKQPASVAASPPQTQELNEFDKIESFFKPKADADVAAAKNVIEPLKEVGDKEIAVDANKVLGKNVKLQAELDLLKQPALVAASTPQTQELSEFDKIENFFKPQMEPIKPAINLEMESLAPKVMSNLVDIKNIHLTEDEYSIFAPFVIEIWDENCSASSGYENPEQFLAVIESQLIGKEIAVDYDFTS